MRDDVTQGVLLGSEEKQPAAEAESFTMMRVGRMAEMDRAFDVEYWQRLGDAAIFRAAWEMVEFYARDRGQSTNELRLQRTVENFQRLSD